MVICSSFFHSPVPAKLHSGCVAGKSIQFRESKFAFWGLRTEEAISQVARSEAQGCKGWSFVGGSKLDFKPRSKRLFVRCKTDPAVYASLWTNSQIASSVFTLGTAAVLPFYTLMVAAPKAEMTKKWMKSCLPYIVFGILYAYLLYLSWTPGTLRAMFASKYWMPELSAIASLFTNEMSLSSAWIHLLAIDLFAASVCKFSDCNSDCPLSARPLIYTSNSACLAFILPILVNICTQWIANEVETRHYGDCYQNTDKTVQKMRTDKSIS